VIEGSPFCSLDRAEQVLVALVEVPVRFPVERPRASSGAIRGSSERLIGAKFFRYEVKSTRRPRRRAGLRVARRRRPVDSSVAAWCDKVLRS